MKGTLGFPEFMRVLANASRQTYPELTFLSIVQNWPLNMMKQCMYCSKQKLHLAHCQRKDVMACLRGHNAEPLALNS